MKRAISLLFIAFLIASAFLTGCKEETVERTYPSLPNSNYVIKTCEPTIACEQNLKVITDDLCKRTEITCEFGCEQANCIDPVAKLISQYKSTPNIYVIKEETDTVAVTKNNNYYVKVLLISNDKVKLKVNNEITFGIDKGSAIIIENTDLMVEIIDIIDNSAVIRLSEQ